MSKHPNSSHESAFDEEPNSTYFFHNGKPKGEYFDLIQSALNTVIEKKGGNCGLSTSIWANKPDTTPTPAHRHRLPSTMSRNIAATSVSPSGTEELINNKSLLVKHGGSRNSRHRCDDRPASSFMQTPKFTNPAYLPPHQRSAKTIQKKTRQLPVKNASELSMKAEEFTLSRRHSFNTNKLSTSATALTSAVKESSEPSDQSHVPSVDDSPGGATLEPISPQKSMSNIPTPEEEIQALLFKNLQEREQQNQEQALRNQQLTSPPKLAMAIGSKESNLVPPLVPSKSMSDLSPIVSAKLAEYAAIACPTKGENEFMAFLLKKEEERARNDRSRILQKTQRKQENITSVKTIASPTSLDVARPQVTLPTEELKDISSNYLSDGASFPIACFGPITLTFVLLVTKQSNSHETSDISNLDAVSTQKPWIAAPNNAWMRVRLSQGNVLSKADEEFQAFIDKKSSPPEQPKNAAVKKRSPQKSTYDAAEEDRRKLATGEAKFAKLLARRNDTSPVKQSTNSPVLPHSPASRNAAKVAALELVPPKEDSVQAVCSDLQGTGNVGVVGLQSDQQQDTCHAREFSEGAVGELSKADAKFPNKIELVENDTVAGWKMTPQAAVGDSAMSQNKNIIYTDAQAIPTTDKVVLPQKKHPASFISSPPFWSVSGFSDVGEKPDHAIVNTSAREGVRATQTQDAKIGLVDWDGESWMPPPIWEERGEFDNGFISAYINEWAATVAPPSNLVDVFSEGFTSGKGVVNNYILSEAPLHEDIEPDVKNPSSELKRLIQTSETASALYCTKLEKSKKSREISIIQSEIHQKEILARQPEPNPFRPKIDTYLRPAIESDIAHILQIYNHYINHSHIPEDQDPLTEEDITFLIKNAKEEKLPVIVAVKGRVPLQSPYTKSKMKLPQYEHIIGFAFSDVRGYGISGKSNGRSRYTTNMHVYVHHKFVRKGVGRSLMDRLLQIMSRAWAARGGYDWLNPDLNPIYETDGARRCHQIVIELPVLGKNDPNYPWIKEFLQKFWFMEESRLKGVGRTSTKESPGEWLDIVYFQVDAAHANEFNPWD
ncbi:hypothetical protein ACMFMG_010146 [Clarireedia jacksonii]